jgi:predicted HTH domain antitoxin
MIIQSNPLQAQKLEIALNQYMERKTDLRGGAAIAGIPYNQFLQEVEERHIILLDADRFGERLTALAELFADEPLKEATQQMNNA